MPGVGGTGSGGGGRGRRRGTRPAGAAPLSAWPAGNALSANDVRAANRLFSACILVVWKSFWKYDEDARSTH